MRSNDWQKAEYALKNGGVAFVPTDTVYGLVARAEDAKAVQRVYKIKGRDDKKPFIVLINKFSDLEKFGIGTKIHHGEKWYLLLKKIWPGKVSVVLPCTLKKFEYLHRGTKSIAFRMIGPKNKNLFKIINSVGPLAAPSANPQGEPTATKRSEGRKYFGNNVDAYVCVGTKISKPSTLITFKNGKPVILRQGSVKI